MSLRRHTTCTTLSPEQSYEKVGFAPGVLFPTGAVLDESGEEVLLFCGGADEVVSVLRYSMDSILEHLGISTRV
ncbi:MAG: hypothetical protein GTO14_13880 [Anaerolineales bacterium]|nr:hypothetical protein [Anaerolineales bacterium]